MSGDVFAKGGRNCMRVFCPLYQRGTGCSFQGGKNGI